MATANSIDKEFNKKYAKEIAGISAANDNVDLSTASAMFKANLNNKNGDYKGGGVATNWGEMLSDYDSLKAKATESVKKSTKKTTNARGEQVNISSLLDRPTATPGGGQAVPMATAPYLGTGAPVGSVGQIGSGVSYNGGVAAPQVDPVEVRLADMRARLESDRQNQQRAMNDALSPDNYNKMFNSIMQQLQPLVQSQNAQISGQATEQRRLADVDAERRGVYNSGVGAVMQNEVSKNETQAMSDALAQIQGQATQLTGQQQDRLLKSIGMQGDWTSTDTNSLLNMLNSSLDYELGKGQLNLGYQNSDRDYELGKGGLALDQQKLTEDTRQFDTKIKEDTRQFDSQMQESVRQFDAEYDFKERSFSEDIRRFEKEMGYKWSSLNASMKASAANAEIAKAEMSMKKEQWSDQKSYNEGQAKLEKLGITGEAYGIVSGLKSGGASKDEALTAIKMYEGYDGELYSDLVNTVTSEWGTIERLNNDSGGYGRGFNEASNTDMTKLFSTYGLSN